MRTIDFKVWLLLLFLCTASTNIMVAINVNRNLGYTAFMNKNKEIYYLYEVEGWQDGDVAEAVEVLPPLDIDNTCGSGIITNVVQKGFIWRYDNRGTFTQISYPWWYTGTKYSTVHTLIISN